MGTGWLCELYMLLHRGDLDWVWGRAEGLSEVQPRSKVLSLSLPFCFLRLFLDLSLLLAGLGVQEGAPNQAPCSEASVGQDPGCGWK